MIIPNPYPFRQRNRRGKSAPWKHTTEYTAYKYESRFGFEMIRSAFRNPWFIRLRGFRTSVFGPKYPLFYPLFFQNGHVKWESSYTRLYMDPLLIVTISLHPVGYRHLYHVKTEEWFRTVNFRDDRLCPTPTNWNLSVSLINPSHASFGIHLVFIIIPG